MVPHLMMRFLTRSQQAAATAVSSLPASQVSPRPEDHLALRHQLHFLRASSFLCSARLVRSLGLFLLASARAGHFDFLLARLVPDPVFLLLVPVQVVLVLMPCLPLLGFLFPS